MSLIAVPNVSTGAVAEADRLASVIHDAGGRVLDVHTDSDHDRSVFTAWGSSSVLVPAMSALVGAMLHEDLANHRGVHPRLGIVDVIPFVPYGNTGMEVAVAAAREAAVTIGRLGISVYLYGAAAGQRPIELPDLRRTLGSPVLHGFKALAPDEGPPTLDPRLGVTCVGARRPLIAFNVWTDAPLPVVQSIAREIRSEGVRALGFELRSRDRRQVSMNLIDPATIGIDDAFELVRSRLADAAFTPTNTEIVGLLPERFMPDPDAQAARLLIEPGRSIESVVRS